MLFLPASERTLPAEPAGPAIRSASTPTLSLGGNGGGAVKDQQARMIKEIGVGLVGPRWRSTELGILRVLVPLPVIMDERLAQAGIDDFAAPDEAWESDFERLARDVVRTIDDGGPMETVVPALGASSFGERLRRLLFSRPERRSHHGSPDKLTPVEALCSAALDASYLAFASVRGRRASVETSNGDPLLWLWTSIDDTAWQRLSAQIARGKPTRTLSLDFSQLGPPGRYGVGSVVVHAATNTVYWTDGQHVLALVGDFLLPHPGNEGCEDPRRVFLPPDQEWERVAPPWAKAVHPRVCEDLETMGLRVVRRQGAAVRAV